LYLNVKTGLTLLSSGAAHLAVLALPTQSNCISSHSKAVSAAAGCSSHAKVMDHLDEANDSAQIISSWFVQMQKIAEELEAHHIDGPTLLGATCMFAVSIWQVNHKIRTEA